MVHERFNIYDLNFILLFAGFAVFTTFAEDISSIVYRAFALGIALICLVKRGKRLKHLSMLSIAFIILVVLLDLKATYYLFTTPLGLYAETRYQALLFTYGVTLLPVLSFIVSYNRIHWKTSLYILEILLLVTILVGCISSFDIHEHIRMQLNERQSTLAFGDNSGYLVILSICLLIFTGREHSTESRFFWRILFLTGFVIGVTGIIQAGSRGPLIATIAGIMFVVFCMSIRKQMTILTLSLLLTLSVGLTTFSVEKLAPVLFTRMAATINKGDLSGREYLYRDAINTITAHPLIGGNPLIVLDKLFTGYHNIYLEACVGLGLLGGFIFIGFILGIIFWLFKNKRELRRPVPLLLSAIFIVGVVRGMTGGSLITNTNSLLFVVFGCMIYENSLIKNQYQSIIKTSLWNL